MQQIHTNQLNYFNKLNHNLNRNKMVSNFFLIENVFFVAFWTTENVEIIELFKLTLEGISPFQFARNSDAKVKFCCGKNFLSTTIFFSNFYSVTIELFLLKNSFFCISISSLHIWHLFEALYIEKKFKIFFFSSSQRFIFVLFQKRKHTQSETVSALKGPIKFYSLEILFSERIWLNPCKNPLQLCSFQHFIKSYILSHEFITFWWFVWCHRLVAITTNHVKLSFQPCFVFLVLSIPIRIHVVHSLIVWYVMKDANVQARYEKGPNNKDNVILNIGCITAV